MGKALRAVLRKPAKRNHVPWITYHWARLRAIASLVLDIERKDEPDPDDTYLVAIFGHVKTFTDYGPGADWMEVRVPAKWYGLGVHVVYDGYP